MPEHSHTVRRRRAPRERGAATESQADHGSKSGSIPTPVAVLVVGIAAALFGALIGFAGGTEFQKRQSLTVDADDLMPLQFDRIAYQNAVDRLEASRDESINAVLAKGHYRMQLILLDSKIERARAAK